MGVSSYAHMLIYSHLFSCDHFFTFQFYALMPKISKENFADCLKPFQFGPGFHFF